MVFLQREKKFTESHHSSFNTVWIDVSGFTFLTDNYCEHSISQILYSKYSVHTCIFMYAIYVCMCIYRHAHSSPPSSFFCFLDHVGFCNQTKQSFRTLRAASFSSPSGYTEKQSILFLHSLGGSATTWIVQCSCHEAWVTKVFTRSWLYLGLWICNDSH